MLRAIGMSVVVRRMRLLLRPLPKVSDGEHLVCVTLTWPSSDCKRCSTITCREV